MANLDPVTAFLSLRAQPHRLTEATPRSVSADGAPTRDREAERAQLKQLAQEFEAMLVNEMLSGWRRSLISGDDDNDASGFAHGGLGTMTDVVGTEFGRALSRSGGLGIAGTLLNAFDRQFAPETHAAPNGRLPLGSLEPLESLESKPAPITSGFGWRLDPVSGLSAFHAGVDVRMAYGQPVASLADGRVSLAGEQGGYGLTVVVDHPDGLQTRYAHLSSIDVQIGDTVGRGQPIARSGSSGRSTGPHLHVELLREGRPVDPSRLLDSRRSHRDVDTQAIPEDADWVS